MENSRRSYLDRLLTAGVFALAFVYSLRRMTDSDLWGHLKCGEYLFQHGSILKTYYYNCSWPDFPYVNHSWLFQAVIYLVQKLFGEAGLVSFQVLMVLLSFFLLYKILRFYTDNITIISFVLTIGVLAASHRFALRPQHFTYVYLLYFLFSLHAYQRGVSRYLWFLPPVMILWANTHAECLWGIFVPAVFILGEYIKSRVRSEQKPGGLKTVVVVFGLVILASLLNPFTYKTVFWPLLVMEEQFAGVEELLAPTTLKYLFFWIYFAVFVVTTALNLKRGDPTWLSLSLIFAAVAWTANRGIPHFVFLSAPVIAANLDAFRKRHRITGPNTFWVSAGAKAVLLAAILFIILSVVTLPRYLKKYDNIPYPEGAVKFIEENGIRGNVFNEHIWGGYIIWNAYPSLRPYIDGRFFHKRFYDEFFPTRRAAPGWEQVIAKYAITIALLQYGEGLGLNDSLFSNPRWRLVYWDDVSLVYLKDVEENRAVIDLYGNSMIDPNRQFLFDYKGWPDALIKQASAIMERNLRNARHSYKALIMSGDSFFSLKDYDSARLRYEEALKYLETPNAWIYYRIALCYRSAGDLKKTEANLVKSLALAPDFGEGRIMLREVRFLLGISAGR